LKQQVHDLPAHAARRNEDKGHPPKRIAHPIIFADPSDPDYQKILAHLQAAKAKLDEIKRFDMPGFRPNQHYIREMQRYGILPKNLRSDTAIASMPPIRHTGSRSGASRRPPD
jgi:hypothetical protein